MQGICRGHDSGRSGKSGGICKRKLRKTAIAKRENSGFSGRNGKEVIPSSQKKQEGKIAPGDEILAFLTETMRGSEETDIKTRMRAAELLGRRNGAFAKEETENSRVIIIDDIGREEG